MRYLTLAVLLVVAAVPAAQESRQTPALLFEIGKPDRGTREFALAPSSYRNFSIDGAFVAGQSDPASDWPTCRRARPTHGRAAAATRSGCCSASQRRRQASTAQPEKPS